MNRIDLTNAGDIIPTFLSIYIVPSDEWQILNIELYADFARTILLADGVEIGQLPRSSQDALIASLNEWDYARRRSIALLDSLVPNGSRNFEAAVTRILEGAFV